MSEEGFIQCQSPRVQVSMTRGRECEVLRGEKRNKFNQAKVSDSCHHYENENAKIVLKSC